VLKRLVEVQYLQTTITDEQRREFGRLVEDTVQRIEACQKRHSRRHSRRCAQQRRRPREPLDVLEDHEAPGRR
jgi:hypothetical protein